MKNLKVCVLVFLILMMLSKGRTHDANSVHGSTDLQEGSHQESEALGNDIEKLEFMISPEDFLHRYISKRTPVLITGVVKHWPAYTRWTEDYLSDIYGTEPVTLDTYFPHNSNAVMPMTEFLQSNKENDIKVSQKTLPSLYADILMPTCLRCNNEVFQRPFNTDILMSHGRGKSVLHIEDRDILLCSIKGRQTVTLVSPLYSKDLYADEGDPIGVSPIDATAVDLEKYPRAQNINALRVDVEEGDMLYIPHLWWRQFSLEDGQHQTVKISWSLRKGFMKNTKIDKISEESTEDMLAFSSVLIQYEKWMQVIGNNAERLECQSQESPMSQYTFESSKDETHNDGDMTEEEPCYYDQQNAKSPCDKSRECMEDDDGLGCTKYVLDYCYEWEDRGCVTDLPQSLNRKERMELDELQDIQSSFLP